MCNIFAAACIFLWLIVLLREIWVYFHSPKVYNAFVEHASVVDDRGKILFYRNIRPALLAAGLVDVDDETLRLCMLELGLLGLGGGTASANNANTAASSKDSANTSNMEKGLTGVMPGSAGSSPADVRVTEEVLLSFDDFANLYELYLRVSDDIVERQASGTSNALGDISVLNMTAATSAVGGGLHGGSGVGAEGVGAANISPAKSGPGAAAEQTGSAFEPPARSENSQPDVVERNSRGQQDGDAAPAGQPEQPGGGEA